MAPVDAAAKPINFRVVFPASWTLRAVQLGGAGMNGIVPNLTGGRGSSLPPAMGLVTYGSDSGHSIKDAPEWTLVDEAIKNLGYMQIKKTHDAAMVLVERLYARKPAVNYYVGTSQGGREALTVAQHYPDDYDGIVSNVPIVNFSSLMLAPELIRIQEKPLDHAGYSTGRGSRESMSRPGRTDFQSKSTQRTPHASESAEIRVPSIESAPIRVPSINLRRSATGGKIRVIRVP